MTAFELLEDVDSQGRELWRTLEPIVFRVGPQCNVVVPKGYVSNFGTVPRWLNWFIRPTELREDAVIHDFLCNERFNLGAVYESGYSRWFADAVLYEAMIRRGRPWWKRFPIWFAVRVYALLKGVK